MAMRDDIDELRRGIASIDDNIEVDPASVTDRVARVFDTVRNVLENLADENANLRARVERLENRLNGSR